MTADHFSRRDPAGPPDSGSGVPVPLPGQTAVGGDVPTSLRPPTAHQRASGAVAAPAGGPVRPCGPPEPFPWRKPLVGREAEPPRSLPSAAAAEPDAYTARSGDRPAGGAPLVPPTAPPATYDEYRPISDWWTDYDDPPVPLRHLALVLLVSLGMWAGIVVALHLAGMWWRS